MHNNTPLHDVPLFNGKEVSWFIESCEAYCGSVGFSEDAKKVEFMVSRFDAGVRLLYQDTNQRSEIKQRESYNKDNNIKETSQEITMDYFINRHKSTFTYKPMDFNMLKKWLIFSYSKYDTVIQTGHLRELASFHKTKGYDQIRDYLAKFETLIVRMKPENKPDDRLLIEIFLTGVKDDHASELLHNFKTTDGLLKYPDWDGFHVQVENANSLFEQIEKFTNPSVKPLENPNRRPFLVGPQPVTQVTKDSAIEELTAEFDKLRLFVAKGYPVDSVAGVSQAVKELFKKGLNITPEPATVPPFQQLAASASTGSTITPPLGVPRQVSRENQTCLCCDKTVAQLQELKRPIHYGFGKCDIYDQMKKKGYPLKEITFINRAGLEKKLVVFDDGTERGQQIPDMRGKGGWEAFMSAKLKEEQAKKGQSGSSKTLMMSDSTVTSQSSEGALLFELMHVLFNPLEFEGNDAKFLEVKSGSYRPVEEVMKLVSGSDISYAEADCAWSSLLQEVENSEDCFFTCQQIAEEVSYLRSRSNEDEADVFAKRALEETDSNPKQPPPKRVQPTRDAKMPQAPFQNVIPTPVPVIPTPVPVTVPLNVPNPLPPGFQNPAMPPNPPPVRPPTPKRPITPTAMKTPVPLADPKPSPKPAQKYHFAHKGILANIDSKLVCERVFQGTTVTMTLAELFALSPAVQKFSLDNLKVHKIPHEVLSDEPVMTSTIQTPTADCQLIQRKLMDTGTLDNVPTGVIQLLQFNTDWVARQEGGQSALDRIFGNLCNLTAQSWHGAIEGYKPISSFTAGSFKIAAIEEPEVPFDRTLQYSTFASPRFYNVTFQKEFVVEIVLMDKGSEMNALSFNLARDASNISAIDTGAMIIMLHAGGGRDRMYGLIRDSLYGLNGGINLRQKSWICPAGVKTPFALLFGMPFVAATKATSTWDNRGNMWTKITSQDGSVSVQYQTVSYSSDRNILEPQRTEPQEAEDMLVIPDWPR